MPIPDYGLHDPVTGKQILSRDPRFNHPWYNSRKYDPYDNDTADDIGVAQSPPGPDELLFPNMYFPAWFID